MADEPAPPASDPTPTPPAPPAPPAPKPTAPAGTTAGDPVRLPDDHPLVTAYAAKKAEAADYKKRLSDIEEANKTEEQKRADRTAALEEENKTLKSTALRNEVAAAKGVPAELIHGTTKAELEASADKVLAFKGVTPPKLPGNQQPTGPISKVDGAEETRDDRKKRLAEGLKR